MDREVRDNRYCGSHVVDMALGPGVPDPPPTYLDHAQPDSRHRYGESYGVHANPILGRLHHEYFLAHACA